MIMITLLMLIVNIYICFPLQSFMLQSHQERWRLQPDAAQGGVQNLRGNNHRPIRCKNSQIDQLSQYLCYLTIKDYKYIKEYFINFKIFHMIE